MLAEAKREAERLVADARDKAAQEASEQEVVKRAEREAADILEEARQREREVRLGAEDYADEVLGTLEVNLGKFLEAVRRGRERLQGRSDEAMGEPAPRAPRLSDGPGGRHRGPPRARARTRRGGPAARPDAAGRARHRGPGAPHRPGAARARPRGQPVAVGAAPAPARRRRAGRAPACAASRRRARRSTVDTSEFVADGPSRRRPLRRGPRLPVRGGGGPRRRDLGAGRRRRGRAGHAAVPRRTAPACARTAARTSTRGRATARRTRPTRAGTPSARWRSACAGRTAGPEPGCGPFLTGARPANLPRALPTGGDDPWPYRSERPPSSAVTPGARRTPSRRPASAAARAARAPSGRTTCAASAGTTGAGRSSRSRGRTAEHAVALDGMGGDHAPQHPVAGAVTAAAEGIHVLLVGDERALRGRAGAPGRARTPASRSSTPPTSSPPARRAPAPCAPSPSRPIATACRLVGEGRAGAAVSVGNTGAMLAAATLYMRRIPGVIRPAIAVVLPATGGGSVLLLDAGASAEVAARALPAARPDGAPVHARRARGRASRASASSPSARRRARAATDVLAALRPPARDARLRGQRRGARHPVGRPRRRRDRRVHRQRRPEDDGGHRHLPDGRGAVRRPRDARSAASAACWCGPSLRRMRQRIDPEVYGGAVLLGVRGLAVIGHGNSSGGGRGQRRAGGRAGHPRPPGGAVRHRARIRGRRTAVRPRRIPGSPAPPAVRPRARVGCRARSTAPGVERAEGGRFGPREGCGGGPRHPGRAARVSIRRRSPWTRPSRRT